MAGDPFITLALSGGGARAIAFHLGCMRALHDRQILSRVRVLSTVSGGSVIGALYAYGSHKSFNEFDERVVDLLRAGLQRQILKALVASSEGLKLLATALVHGGAGLSIAGGMKLLPLILCMDTRQRAMVADTLMSWRELLPVWGSLTTAFELILRQSLFGDALLGDVKVRDLETVINATELRTGTAFRFGSVASGGWRYGQIEGPTQITVAKAVAASAAFPMLLPPIVERFTFLQRGARYSERVVLSDGGVYDNLGVSVLEPGRSAEISVNAYPTTHIISLNAGAGQFPVGPTTFWWGGRTIRAFETIYRRSQDASYGRLHSLAVSGAIEGFAMIYLGQQDSRLPVRPPDLIPREAVKDYPTDFAPMSEQNIARLSGRGEQLTRILIAQYLGGL